MSRNNSVGRDLRSKISYLAGMALLLAVLVGACLVIGNYWLAAFGALGDAGLAIKLWQTWTKLRDLAGRD